jgi:predicted aspartyl protease
MVNNRAVSLMKIKSSYSSEESPGFPELKAELSDPLSRISIEIKAKVDTGFSGGLLVSLDDYTRLGLQFHEMPAVFGRLASGATVSLKSSQGILKLSQSERVQCEVYTTPLVLRPLIGRKLLNLWRLSLDGPRNVFELDV